MLYLESNGTIRLTRGDTAYLTVPIKIKDSNDDIEDYVMNSSDTLIFSVKKSIRDEEYSFQKTIQGKNTIHIEPTDTAGLSFGKYKYDVQLTTSSGDVFTLVDTSDFEILSEVTVNVK